MPDKIYAWLLRLYPSRFREAYGDDALQLFRDRFRDEQGFLPRVRLWFDLLADLALSLPREYFRVQPELVSYSVHLRSDGVPSFFLLAEESRSRRAALRKRAVCGGADHILCFAQSWCKARAAERAHRSDSKRCRGTLVPAHRSDNGRDPRFTGGNTHAGIRAATKNSHKFLPT